MLRKKHKFPCYVLIYEQVDIIKESLDFLCSYASELDIIVIENPSKNSPVIKRYVNDLGKSGLIQRYYKFRSNITNNAFDVVLNKELPVIKRSTRLIITDGDIARHSGEWLPEALRAVKDRKVFACGASLSLHNLPVKTFPESIHWLPPNQQEFDNYYTGFTGVHLLTLRSREFIKFMQWKNKNEYNFIDNRMHEYSMLRKLRWARTKSATVTHLTWDLYNDPTNSYTKKKTGTFNKIWHHHRTATYTLTEY